MFGCLGAVVGIVAIAVLVVGVIFAAKFFGPGKSDPTPPGVVPRPTDPSTPAYQANAMASEWLASYAKRLNDASSAIRSGTPPGDAAKALGVGWQADRQSSHSVRITPLEATYASVGAEGSTERKEAYAKFLDQMAEGVKFAAQAATPIPVVAKGNLNP